MPEKMMVQLRKMRASREKSDKFICELISHKNRVDKLHTIRNIIVWWMLACYCLVQMFVTMGIAGADAGLTVPGEDVCNPGDSCSFYGGACKKELAKI